jgi:hypothetical protein
MARVVVRDRPVSHEEFAIVSMNPLPTNVLDFAAVREVVQEFLE